jgi:cob(I)alamin adenosyltransferase
MVKAKDIISVKDSIVKYKAELDKETDFVKRLKIESKFREQKYRLMDVECQLFNIEIYLYKNAQLYKQVFMDRYINGLTQNQLITKYNMARTTIYKILKTSREAFEGKKHL